MSYPMVKEVQLPTYSDSDAEPVIMSVVESLGIQLNVLASSEDIETVWGG